MGLKHYMVTIIIKQISVFTWTRTNFFTLKQAQAQGYTSTVERVRELDVFFMFAHTSHGQESRPTSHDMQMQLEHLYLFKEPRMREREEAEGGRSEELRENERERESDLTCRRSSSPVWDSRGEYKCYYINPLPQRSDRQERRRKARKKGREN